MENIIPSTFYVKSIADSSFADFKEMFFELINHKDDHSEFSSMSQSQRFRKQQSASSMSVEEIDLRL